MIMDVSPNCDCHGENDVPILPNIGMFASFDPLALDQACADACLAASPMPDSQLARNMEQPDFVDHHDHFTQLHPGIGMAELSLPCRKDRPGKPPVQSDPDLIRIKADLCGGHIRSFFSTFHTERTANISETAVNAAGRTALSAIVKSPILACVSSISRKDATTAAFDECMARPI